MIARTGRFVAVGRNLLSGVPRHSAQGVGQSKARHCCRWTLYVLGRTNDRRYCDPEEPLHGTMLPGSRTCRHGKLEPKPAGSREPSSIHRRSEVGRLPVANPEVITLGDPFGAGVSVGFRCHRSVEGPMLLYTVLVLATQEVSDVRFTLEKRQPPSNPFFHCPVIIDCDDPIFTMYCVDTQPCFVNASTAVPCSSPTAVLDRSWSAMKALYRGSD